MGGQFKKKKALFREKNEERRGEGLVVPVLKVDTEVFSPSIMRKVVSLKLNWFLSPVLLFGPG